MNYFIRWLKNTTLVFFITSICFVFNFNAMATDSFDLVALPKQAPDVQFPNQLWPEGSPVLKGTVAELNKAIDVLFSKRGRANVPDTRALLIVQSGKIVFERYADGFGKDTRFHSWSMAKSYTQALIGILMKQNHFTLDTPAPVPEWQGDNDPRKAITYRQLLNMTSGVDNSDAGGAVTEAIFGEGIHNVVHYSALYPLIREPGTYWEYSTATSTILAGLVGNATGQTAEKRKQFIDQHLLNPLGASETRFTFDKAGHFLGGSHVYATARDYARFGLLYLRDGVWGGNRILPQGWVDFARSAVPTENGGNYGGHFWLNHEPKAKQLKGLPGGPMSVFFAGGNNGQYIFVVPTHDIVMVRLGEIHADDDNFIKQWKILNQQLANVLAVFPEITEVAKDEIY
jgi:CubicO group peptidase (beta-lactamase class C family)